MNPLLLIKIGPTSFAVLDKLRALQGFDAFNDDDAFEMAREFAKGRALELEAGLRALAQRRNANTRELTDGEWVRKGNIAASLFLPETYRHVLRDPVLVDFFEAARDFASALAGDTRDEWMIGCKLTGEVEETRFDRDLVLVVRPGDMPALHILERAIADELFRRDAEPTDGDHISVDFLPEPRELTQVLGLTWRLDTVPHVEIIEGGDLRDLDEKTAEMIAACMAMLALRMAEGVTEMTFGCRVPGKLELALAATLRSTQ